MANVEIKIVDKNGKAAGSRKASALFSTSASSHLLYQAIRWQRAKSRAGTHATKTRATMSGGGIKPWKQKGTGRARSGSNTSPLWVGGGIAHGPKPRSYEFRMNRQEKRKALFAAISTRQTEGCFHLVQDFGLEQIKTKEALQTLRKLGISSGDAVVVVISPEDVIAEKSFRNIARVTVLKPAGLNVYDVVKAKHLVMTEAALSQFEERALKQ